MMRHVLPWSKLSKIRLIVLIICIIALSYYISANWYQLSLIRGESMSPAYHNMQFVIVDRHSKNYTYGDVITFRCENLHSVLAKRIAACPGDTVIIRDGRLYVNDKISSIFDQEYLFEYSGIARYPLQLGTDQYFVIGDNVAESKDSRYEEISMVGGADIVGKIIYPLSKPNSYSR